MAEHIQEARESIQRASDAARANVHEQLIHLDEGLMEQSEGDKTQSEPLPDIDDIEQIEEKLVGLADESDDETVRRHLEDARDHLDSYRRARGLPDEERD